MLEAFINDFRYFENILTIPELRYSVMFLFQFERTEVTVCAPFLPRAVFTFRLNKH
jgi:hypothetical protein